MINEKEVRWFILRIRNSSPGRLVAMNDRLQDEATVVDTYYPRAFMKVSDEKMDFAPSLVNFIYVRISMENLRKLKGNKTAYDHLSYIMHPVYDEKYNKSIEPLYLSDKKMEEFMRITATENEKIIFFNNLDYACKPSQGVQITEGAFAGEKGRVKRIRGNKCIVVTFGREVALAITGVGRSQMRYLTAEEMEEE